MSTDIPNESISFRKTLRKLFNYKKEKGWSYFVCLITFVSIVFVTEILTIVGSNLVLSEGF